jgi:hypothetical protein
MNETSTANQKNKAGKVRPKREHKRVLRPTFAAVRHAQNGSQWTENDRRPGDLMRRATVDPLPDNAASREPAEVQTFSETRFDYDFSRVPAHTAILNNKRIIQANLTVNKPGDRHEQEADRVADRVLRMPAPAIQLKGT